MEFQPILSRFFENHSDFKPSMFGTGLIHRTYILEKNNKPAYILQEVNVQVFTKPWNITSNLNALDDFLNKARIHDLFPMPINTLDGQPYAIVNDTYFRIVPFIENSHSIATCQNPDQAYQAAFQFGNFTAQFHLFDSSSLKPTIPGFHDLIHRWLQFEQSLQNAKPERFKRASAHIQQIKNQYRIVETYLKITKSQSFKKRVTHHDTKISNVLFDIQEKGICVIDLDTVMSGYFISDLGDMFRTYLSPENEESTQISDVVIRPDFYKAIVDGYLEKIADQFTEDEKQLLNYSGEFMIYMQALRFLTDFLNNDIYYGISYEMNNYDRTSNQLKLLTEFQQWIR
jgi:Ser/Thr protein kinase RdoA (MazF antagonist)